MTQRLNKQRLYSLHKQHRVNIDWPLTMRRAGRAGRTCGVCTQKLTKSTGKYIDTRYLPYVELCNFTCSSISNTISYLNTMLHSGLYEIVLIYDDWLNWSKYYILYDYRIASLASYPGAFPTTSTSSSYYSSFHFVLHILFFLIRIPL